MATEDNAYGFCARCGFRYPLEELKYEVKNYKRTNTRVCPDCFDVQNPQDLSNLFKGSDDESLRDPRPDTGKEASRWGNSVVWNFDSGLSPSDTANVEWSGTMVNGWNYGDPASDVPKWTLTLDSTSQSVTAVRNTIGQSSMGLYIDKNFTPFRGLNTDVDPEVLKILRVRIRMIGDQENVGTWTGHFFWGYSDGYISSDVSTYPFVGGVSGRYLTIQEPDWNKSMGDRFIDLEWDVSEDPEWKKDDSGSNIKNLRFDLYTTTDSAENRSFEIDSIRVEEN